MYQALMVRIKRNTCVGFWLKIFFYLFLRLNFCELRAWAKTICIVFTLNSTLIFTFEKFMNAKALNCYLEKKNKIKNVTQFQRFFVWYEKKTCEKYQKHKLVFIVRRVNQIKLPQLGQELLSAEHLLVFLKNISSIKFRTVLSLN